MKKSTTVAKTCLSELQPNKDNVMNQLVCSILSLADSHGTSQFNVLLFTEKLEYFWVSRKPSLITG